MENTVELTLNVSPDTVTLLKEYAAQKGKSLGDVTEHISRTVNGLLIASLKEGTATFALRPTAIQKLNAFASLKGKSKDEVSMEISETLSEVLESVLTEAIAGELGLPTPLTKAAKNYPIRRQQAAAPIQDTTGISDGLGDDDLEPQMIPPSEEDGASMNGGPSDDDLDNDLEVSEPEKEAKSDASSFSDLISGNQSEEESVDLFASIAGLDKDYVDPRITKRLKGKTKSRGRVKPLTQHVEAEGAGI